MCGEAVREFAPRELAVGGLVYAPPKRPRTSRWRAGPTSFGPLGRLVATALVLLFAPWNAFFMMLVYVPVATLVLRHVWKAERVDDEEPPPRLRRIVAERAPWLARDVGRVTLTVVAGLALVGVVVAWQSQDTGLRYLMAFAGATVGLGFVWAWLSGL
jgi:hypothetical protein